jgi:hypothetical protein
MVAKQYWTYGRGLTTSIPSLATVVFTGEEEFPMEHFKDDEAFAHELCLCVPERDRLFNAADQGENKDSVSKNPPQRINDPRSLVTVYHSAKQPMPDGCPNQQVNVIILI